LFFEASKGEFYEPSPEERAHAVWRDVDRAFGKPVTRSDDAVDYGVTQIISEFFKIEGLDGIVYGSNFGDEAINVALFDIDSADCIGSWLYRVKSTSIEAYEAG
jgi:hypothetical protein